MWINSKIRLGGDTKKIATKTGAEMRTGYCFADTGSDDFPMSIVAFNNMADELARYHKGDALMISGNLQANNYTNKDGVEITGWQCVLDSIAGVKKQRPAFQQPKKKPESFDAGHSNFNQINDSLPDKF